MRGLILLAALLLASCTVVYQLPAPPPVAAPIVAVPEPVVPAIPVWIPEPWHVYELDAVEAIRWDFDAAGSVYEYTRLVTVVPMDIELHNRDNPGDPWHMAVGGME